MLSSYLAPSFLKWLFTFVAFIIKAVYGEIMTILSDLQKISRKIVKTLAFYLCEYEKSAFFTWLIRKQKILGYYNSSY